MAKPLQTVENTNRLRIVLDKEYENSPRFQIWLQREFTEKCRKNPRYSLRAFARLLQLDASSVSQLLAGKRQASPRMIHKICDQLSTPPELREQIIGRNSLVQNLPQATYQLVAADAFAVIANWYHYAILELTFTKNFQSSPVWIAKKLGISPVEASVAIQRLERLDLLERRKGQLVKTKAFLTNYSEGFTAPAHKELQRQILQKALHAIDHTAQAEKDITSITMAIDIKKLPAAKEKIKKFRRSLCKFLSAGDSSRVYNFALQLYPVSEPGDLDA